MRRNSPSSYGGLRIDVGPQGERLVELVLERGERDGGVVAGDGGAHVPRRAPRLPRRFAGRCASGALVSMSVARYAVPGDGELVGGGAGVDQQLEVHDRNIVPFGEHDCRPLESFARCNFGQSGGGRRAGFGHLGAVHAHLDRLQGGEGGHFKDVDAVARATRARRASRLRGWRPGSAQRLLVGARDCRHRPGRWRARRTCRRNRRCVPGRARRRPVWRVFTRSSSSAVGPEARKRGQLFVDAPSPRAPDPRRGARWPRS